MFGGKPFYGDANLLGYRGAVPDTVKPAGEFRIFLLGGSTVYFGGPSIAEALQDIFKEQRLEMVKVFNFGVPSTKSGEELARLLYEVVDYHPDMVLVYNGGNDLADHLGDPRPGYPFNFFAFENNPLLDREVSDYPLFDLMLYSSHLLRLFLGPYFLERFFHYKSLQEEWREDAYGHIEKRAKIYVQNTEKMHKIARAFDFELYTFFQPQAYFWQHFKKFKSLDIDPQNKKEVEDVMWGRHCALKGMKEKKLGDHFVDLSTLFFQHPEAFMDWIHVHSAQNRVIAQSMWQHLKVRLLSILPRHRPAGIKHPHN